jgi:hypothetical protein
MAGELPQGAQGTGGFEVRDRTAVRQCEEQINWFASHSWADWFLYRTFQVGVIVLSGASPVLLLFTNLPKPLLMRSIPSWRT